MAARGERGPARPRLQRGPLPLPRRRTPRSLAAAREKGDEETGVEGRGGGSCDTACRQMQGPSKTMEQRRGESLEEQWSRACSMNAVHVWRGISAEHGAGRQPQRTRVWRAGLLAGGEEKRSLAGWPTDYWSDSLLRTGRGLLHLTLNACSGEVTTYSRLLCSGL